MIFYERYENECRKIGISPVSKYAAEKLHCSKSSISRIAQAEGGPKADTIIRAAEMLNVSSDYLLGIIDSPMPIDNTLTEEECEILCSLRELNEDGLFAAKSMIAGIEAQERYRKCNKEEEEISQEKHC